MSAPELNNTQQVSDASGMPSIEFLIFLAKLADYINALEARIEALEP